MTLTTAPRRWTGFERTCSPVSIASGPRSNESAWLDGLSSAQIRETAPTVPTLHEHQIIPPVDWRTWVLLGGRGAGKTHAGAHWISEMARTPGLRFALVGPTLHDVREVMVEGPSGLKAFGERSARPRWEAGRKRLVWPNRSMAYAYSAEDPDSLRGPQFHHGWADEFCAWRKPEAVLEMLRLGLRLGEDPRLMVTTTPRPLPALRRLLAQDGTCIERAGTAENAEHLSPGFLKHLRTLYAGTRLEAQELEGLIVESEGALFRAEDLARARGARPARLDRIVVAVDPPASEGGDACGIIVAGRRDRTAYVLADRTLQGRSPQGWAAEAVAAAREFEAVEMVAEANQGGDMVRSVLAQAGCPVAIRLVHATRGKRVRAEPVAALYEQGRVVHCEAFPALEEQLMALGCGDGGSSPDRADALVWAVTRLLPAPRPGPRLRRL